MDGLLIVMSEATKDSQPPKMKALEAKAVDKAKATADAAFKPSMSILNAKTAEALMKLVDGPEFSSYDAKESVYAGRTIPVGAGKSLTVPIQVTVPGSVVEYSIEVENYDVGLAIDAERDEGVTIVKVCMFFFFFFTVEIKRETLRRHQRRLTLGSSSIPSLASIPQSHLPMCLCLFLSLILYH